MSSSMRERRNTALRNDLVRGSMSHLFRRCIEHVSNCHRQFAPLRSFVTQTPASGAGQRVILRLALVFAFTPFGRDPAFMFQPVQGRVKRSLRDLQRILRNLLNAEQDAVAMQRPERHGFQNQHVQSALEDIDLFTHFEKSLSPRDSRTVLLEWQGGVRTSDAMLVTAACRGSGMARFPYILSTPAV